MNNIKKYQVYLLLILILLQFSFLACSKKEQKIEKPEVVEEKQSVLDSLPKDDPLVILKDRLDLTETQVDTIWSIYKNSRKRMHSNFENHGHDIKKIRELRVVELNRLDKDIEKILSFEQYDKYQVFKKEREMKAKKLIQRQDQAIREQKNKTKK